MRYLPVDRHRRWANRDVTRELDHHGRRWLWFLVAGFVLAASPLACWQLEQNECLRLSHEAERLRADQERLDEEIRRLRTERESLRSLPAIERWAAKNGLVHPETEQVIVVVEATSVTTELLAANAERLARNE